MRIVIETPDYVGELLRARQTIDALLHPLMPGVGQQAPVSRSTTSLRLRELALTMRTRNALAAVGILTVETLTQCRAATLLCAPGFGRKSLEEVVLALEGIGLRLRADDQGETS